MSQQLVLVTGATGHIGFRTLVEVLRSGYRARVTTRNAGGAEKIKTAKSIRPYLANIEYYEVPDITVDGAFDTAIKGVDLVLHIASPIPDLAAEKDGKFDVKKTYLQPAKAGTLSILESARQEKSVKRVVMTASVVILKHDNKDTSAVSPANVEAAVDPDSVPSESWQAYRASKILTYHASQDWMAANKPNWDLLYVLPSYTQGGNELLKRVEDVGKGSNDIMIEVVSGNKERENIPLHSGLVLVDDVAKLHVAALDTTKGKNGDRYIAAYPQRVQWTDILPIVQKLFPYAVEKGVITVDGKQQSSTTLYDVSASTGTFDIEFQGLEPMVKSLVGQYIELKQKN